MSNDSKPSETQAQHEPAEHSAQASEDAALESETSAAVAADPSGTADVDQADADNQADSQVEVDAASADAAEDTAEPSGVDTAEAADAGAEGTADAADDSADDTANDGADKETPKLSIVPVQPLTADHIRGVIEAALLAADDALTIDRLFKLFVPGELAEEGARAQVRDALTELEAACEGRGFELKKVASGYRMQVRQDFSPWVSRLWEEKPPRYTRALLETMALIAYKQPATRGDIEEVRGVTVSSNIMRTLLERGWIREVGQRDVPGRPSMYGTTKEFLDYFNLSSLDELPSLPEIRELVEPAATTPDDSLNQEEAQRSEATKALLAEDLDAVDAGAEAEAEAEAETETGTEADAEAQADAEADAEAETTADAEELNAKELEGDDLNGEAPGADAAIEVSAEPSAADGNSADAEASEGAAAPATDGLQGVPGVGGSNDAAAPVFADNEVLVVSESATVEVHSDAPAETRSSADAKE